MLNKVDLPQPDGPMIERNSPSSTARLTSSIAVSGPCGVAKRLVRCWTASRLMILPRLPVRPGLRESRPKLIASPERRHRIPVLAYGAVGVYKAGVAFSPTRLPAPKPDRPREEEMRKFTRRVAAGPRAARPPIAGGPRLGRAAPRTLKISHQFPGGTLEQGDFRDRLARRFAAEVEKRTNGELKFDI